MEIERKWLVGGWPEGLPCIALQEMRQGYVSVHPTVRIREEKNLPAKADGTDYILCIKSGAKDRAGMVREEIEIPIGEPEFRRIEAILPHALIFKERRTYRLPDGRALEVNLVDPGAETSFMYAEIEFSGIEEAAAWSPEGVPNAAGGPDLGTYLSCEVTGDRRYTMASYWRRLAGVE